MLECLSFSHSGTPKMSNTTTPATTHRLKLRTLKLSDYDAIKSIMDRVYTPFGGAWPKSKFTAMLNRFPQGQIGVEDNGVIIAAAFAVIVDYQAFGDNHTYSGNHRGCFSDHA